MLGGKRTQRIPTEDLRAVYREGDALRVEYQSGESARVVLPFWADDRETAEKIVRLLPTSQTVEMEHSTDVTHSGKPRADWRMLLSMAVMLVALMVGSWALYDRTQLPLTTVQVPVSDPVAADAPFGSVLHARRDGVADRIARVASGRGSSPAATGASPAVADAASSGSGAVMPDFLEPPPVELREPGPLPMPRDYNRIRSEDFVIPIAPDTTQYYVGKTQLAAFEQEANQLAARWDVLRDRFRANVITAEEFAEKLDDLEMRWWDVTFRIFDNEALSDPALLDLRATMLSIVALLAQLSQPLRDRRAGA